MLKLPNVTLVAVDTICHQLTKMAIEDSTKEIEFNEVIVFSDKKDAVPDFARWVPIHIADNYEAEHFLWYSVPFHISTSHYLCIQWDGFVINPQIWNEDWLNYDYIGAPWAYFDNYNVGNGGFSLRSVKLTKHIARHVDRYKFRPPEDGMICRIYGDRLQRSGYNFPGDIEAARFSVETVFPKPDFPHFGFHGIYNFPRVFTKEKLTERLSLLPEYAKVRGLYRFVQWGLEDVEKEGYNLGYMKLAESQDGHKDT